MEKLEVPSNQHQHQHQQQQQGSETTAEQQVANCRIEEKDPNNDNQPLEQPQEEAAAADISKDNNDDDGEPSLSLSSANYGETSNKQPVSIGNLTTPTTTTTITSPSSKQANIVVTSQQVNAVRVLFKDQQQQQDKEQTLPPTPCHHHHHHHHHNHHHLHHQQQSVTGNQHHHHHHHHHHHQQQQQLHQNQLVAGTTIPQQNSITTDVGAIHQQHRSSIIRQPQLQATIVSANRRLIERQIEAIQEADSRRWNFDFRACRPLHLAAHRYVHLSDSSNTPSNMDNNNNNNNNTDTINCRPLSDQNSDFASRLTTTTTTSTNTSTDNNNEQYGQWSTRARRGNQYYPKSHGDHNKREE